MEYRLDKDELLFEDCMMLVEAHKENLDIKHLEAHSKELASYDVSADRIIGVIDHFMELP